MAKKDYRPTAPERDPVVVEPVVIERTPESVSVTQSLERPVVRTQAPLLSKSVTPINREPASIEAASIRRIVRKPSAADPFERVIVIRKPSTMTADRAARDRFGNRIWPEMPKIVPAPRS